MKNKCVYIIYRNDTGLPCYVGMGTHKRFMDRQRNVHVNRIHEKFGTTRTKVIDFVTTEQAHSIERDLIRAISKSGIKLCNMTKGGDGSDGWVPSKENRENMSNGQKRSLLGVSAEELNRRAEVMALAVRKPVYCSNGMLFDSRTKAVEWLRNNVCSTAGESGISAAINKKGQRSAYGFFWSNDGVFDDSEKIGVDVAVCCSNGMTFESITKAAKWVIDNIDRNAKPSNAIAAASKPGGGSSYGLLWWRDGDNKKTGKTVAYKRKVLCSNGMVFDGLSGARDWLKKNGFPKATSARVLGVINGERNQSYGFTWRYMD